MIDDATIRQAAPLLAFIRQPESGGNYDIVWGGIKNRHRPPQPLTTMTIRQVLNWQDSIDRLYRSEAAGAYQILEDTLRGLYQTAGLTDRAIFDRDTQDRLATALLIRRGYLKFLRGDLSTEDFANNLAKEWASLPVVSGPKKGQSYYGGDGLNRAHVTVDAVLDAVRAAHPMFRRVSHPDPLEQAAPWYVEMLAMLADLFSKWGKK